MHGKPAHSIWMCRRWQVIVIARLVPSCRLNLRAGFDADVLASHAIGLGSTFARARVGWKPEASWRVGVEAIQSQGPTYRVRQQGAFVMWPLTRDVSIDLSAGRAKSQDGVQSGYLGLGLSRLF